ncbi:PucR family transcriptional regulator [Nocardia jinanensis]|uniref:PucR family transcriptional regulator n=1 Tax=Nocardia jinanensis TaxID=382504 RepID=UPI0016676914|nr:helix-turn-helix domain-containing protein [Nocardia jinanensis]
MTSSSHAIPELEIAGMPAVTHLRRTHRLSQQLLDHLAGDNGAEPAATMPCGVVRREAAEVVAGCLELVAAALQGRAVGDVPERLHSRIEDWAAEGVALEAVQHATHLGFRFVLELLAGRAHGADGPMMVAAGQRLAEVLDRIITGFTRAYLRELRANTAARHAGAEALAAALIAGAGTAETARENGFRNADSYAVLALALPGAAHDAADAGYDRTGARRRLRRLRTELCVGGDMPPARLSEAGGTVLVPRYRDDDVAVTRLFERLRVAARSPLLATVVHARREEIPDATRRAHELLDLAQRLHRPARLYRLADLAVEYQITRPGPARRRLATALDPLLSQPELLHTLATHLANDRNRQLTARALYIHANTLDYRLRRIAHHTGLDPAHADDLWHLQAALVANAYETDPAVGGPIVVPVEQESAKHPGPAGADPAGPDQRARELLAEAAGVGIG